MVEGEDCSVGETTGARSSMPNLRRKDRGASTLCVTPALHPGEGEDYLDAILTRIYALRIQKCDRNHSLEDKIYVPKEIIDDPFSHPPLFIFPEYRNLVPGKRMG